MANKLLILLIGIAFVGCGHSTDKLNGVWISGDLTKLQSVLVIENGMFFEYSMLPYRHKATIDGDEIKLKTINPFPGDEDEHTLKYKFTGDTLIINNIKVGVEYMYIRRGSKKLSEIIISNSKRKINLPQMNFCETDEINSEHNIFIDKQNNIDRTIVLDDTEIKVRELASAGIHTTRDGFEERIINLYIDKDVSYKYLKDIELQLRMSNNHRVRYVLDENQCEINKDSTQLQLNYYRANLSHFVGWLHDSIERMLPPRPGAHEIKSENSFIVKVKGIDKFILNDKEMNRETFLNKLDSIVLNVPKYVLVYGFNENAAYKDYLDFRITFHNQLNDLRNDYSNKEFGISYDQLAETIGNSDSIKDNYKIVKKKIPQRLMSIEDYEINKKLFEDAK